MIIPAKVLTMCQGGNSRSVAMAYLMKYKYQVDALACGWEKNSPETIAMLCDWADKIIIMQPQFIESIPEKSRPKVVVIDVGPDRWFNGLHPDLVSLCDSLLQKRAEVPA